MQNNHNDGAMSNASFRSRDGNGYVPPVHAEDEDAYWRSAFRDEAYFNDNYEFGDYHPAYVLGYHGPGRFGGTFEEAAARLNKEWELVKGKSRLSWDEARMAIRAAWDKVDPTR